MVLVKILGGIDLVAAFALFLIIFGIQPLTVYILFCALTLIVKSLFIFSGDVLSFIDLGAGIVLFISIIFSPWQIFIWVFALMLFAKGLISFV